MSQKLKVGIVGCGSTAVRHHLPALAHYAERAEVLAFCDLILPRAEAAAKDFGAPGARVFADYRELVDMAGLDAVIVCTYNATHTEISLAALSRGLHVLCEKPAAITSADARLLLEAAEKSGKIFTVSYQNRFREDALAAKDLVRRGELGRVYFARAHSCIRRRVPSWGVFTNQELMGGGAVIDEGCHSLDLTLWLMDNYAPKNVMGVTFDFLGKGSEPGCQGNSCGPWDPEAFQVEDSGFGFITMADGALVQLEAAWAINMPVFDYAQSTLCGTAGGISMEPKGMHCANRLFLNKIIGDRQTITEISTDRPLPKGAVSIPEKEIAFVRQMQNFLDAAEGRDEIVVTPRQTLVVTGILEALYRSARTGELARF